jgi:hypothetical protein
MQDLGDLLTKESRAAGGGMANPMHFEAEFLQL